MLSTATYNPEEEHDQLPSITHVPEDHWTTQAGLKTRLGKRYLNVEACSIFVNLYYGTEAN
jgi:hypothetical protein